MTDDNNLRELFTAPTPEGALLRGLFGGQPSLEALAELFPQMDPQRVENLLMDTRYFGADGEDPRRSHYTRVLGFAVDLKEEVWRKNSTGGMGKRRLAAVKAALEKLGLSTGMTLAEIYRLRLAGDLLDWGYKPAAIVQLLKDEWRVESVLDGLSDESHWKFLLASVDDLPEPMSSSIKRDLKRCHMPNVFMLMMRTDLQIRAISTTLGWTMERGQRVFSHKSVSFGAQRLKTIRASLESIGLRVGMTADEIINMVNPQP
jgi:hypothetical protein